MPYSPHHRSPITLLLQAKHATIELACSAACGAIASLRCCRVRYAVVGQSLPASVQSRCLPIQCVGAAPTTSSGFRACDLIRGALLISIPLAYYFGILGILQLLVAVFVVGICTVLFEVADLAALPHVVHGSQLAHARSLSEGIEATATVVGPSLGGLIVGLGRTAVSGSVIAYLVDSLSYLISAAALLSVRRPLQAPRTHAHPPLREAMREGLGFLWRHPTLRLLMVLTTIVNFLQAPMSLFVILVAQQRFALSPAQIGLLFGMAGGAAVLGSMLAAWWYRVERLQSILIGSLIVWLLSAIVLALAPGPLLLAAGLALTYLIWPLYAVAVVSYRLAETPDHLQGRVISAFRTLSYGAEPLGLAAGGLAATLASPSLLFTIIGVALLICVSVIVRARK